MKTRGYALPLVMMLLLILGGLVTTMVVYLEGSIAIGESALHRRQAFHLAEGVQLGAIEVASTMLRTLPSVPPNIAPTDAGYAAALQTMLTTQAQTISTALRTAFPETFTVDKYQLPKVELGQLRPAETTVLNEGSFSGMQAQVQRFNITVDAKRLDAETQASVLLTSEVARATIAMFQFYIFSNEYLDLDPGGTTPLRMTGRIHTNGDFCIAGNLELDTITSAGRIRLSNREGQCRRRATEANTIKIATSDALSAFTNVLDDSSLNGSYFGDTAWRTVPSAFARRVLDSTHGVAPLRLPIAGRPRVQSGANVLAMEATSSTTQPALAAREDNTDSLRFLVDPLLVTEPDDVQRQKFAYKADIRIIDGVWFLRDPSNPDEMGTPIWSDHVGSMDGTDSYHDFPGSNAGSRGKNIVKSYLIGQHNIRGAAPSPQRYSPYAFRPATAGAPVTWDWSNTKRAVVSYGVLHREGSGPDGYFYSPGRIESGSTARNTTVEHFLTGVRSGFKNGWIEARSESDSPAGASTVETNRSRILPLNFDVAAFIAALNDTSPGELGSHFSSGRMFNGVVYISATWPGSMDGLSAEYPPSGTTTNNGFAVLWPSQPVDATGSEAGVYNAGLPMLLCGASAHPTSGSAPNIQPCASGAPFVNFVRVVNAKHLSPAGDTTYAEVTIPANALPNGLTIATNLPIAVVGDANVDTTPKTLRSGTSTRFVPFLVAGDRFHRHSKGWQDSNARWDTVTNFNTRQAESTRQHLQILAGWNPTPSATLSGHDHSSDGVEDFPRYNENWNCSGVSATSTFYGSIVVGFASVYERTGANNEGGHTPSTATFTTCFPTRVEGFDFNLEDPRLQPPGAPLILAQSVSFVARR
jgi:hypothetical protein